MIEVRNILAATGPRGHDELVERLADGSRVRIERIVSRGHASPAGFWYDQEETEWVLLASGRAILEFENGEEPIALEPGDCLEIGAHVRHRVAWTDPQQATVWVAVFYR